MQYAINVALILILIVVATSCSDEDGNDWHRLVCEVQTVNAGSPLVSAYTHAGSDKIAGTDDDYTPIDAVQVVFHARPYGSTVTLPEDGAQSWFQIERYDLEWENNAATLAAGIDLTNHDVLDGNVDIMVPVYEEGAGSVLIVGIDVKNEAWFADLFTGDIPSFQADAHLTFYGHESGSEETVELPAGLRVLFIPAIVED